jgi:hypothetical protein
VLLVTGLLSGCGARSEITGATGSNAGGSSQDQVEVSSQLAGSPDLVDESVFEANVEAEIDPSIAPGPAPMPPDSAGHRPPFRFWRRITDVRRTFEFSYRDTDSTGRPRVAVVTVNKILSGTFNVAKPPRDPASRPVVIQKPLLDRWVRHLVLERVNLPGFARPQWRIVGTSGVEIASRAAATRIVSVRVQAAGFDSTISDPLAIFRLRRVLSFDGQDSVRITVTTSRNDDVVVLQHPDHHLPFRNNGDNTYSIQLRTGMMGGVHHLGIDALAHGTLFDDAAAYDSQAWILPYVVKPTVLADAGR